MSKKPRGLGKGLNELLSVSLGHSSMVSVDTMGIGSSTSSGASAGSATMVGGLEALRRVSIEKIQTGPFQPRISIRHEGVEQLAESIRAQGILQPIVVREKTEGTYEIVAGERRWRAAQLAGLHEIPVIVKDVSDEAAFAIALIENIQRENLNPIEEARAMKRLADKMELTHLQVAEAVGKSRTSVTNLIRLLTLNSEVQTLLEMGDIDMGHARALLSLKGPLQSQVAKMVMQRGLSVRETERIVQKLQDDPQKKSPPKPIDPNISRLEGDLTDKLGSPVMIRHSQQGRGMLVIKYNNVDELEGILEHFN